ncbi:MAG: hypothetical protein ACREFY_14240 [Acetobacteraceae bacterium]
MPAGNKAHLAERAAERLIKAGGAASGLGFGVTEPAPLSSEGAVRAADRVSAPYPAPAGAAAGPAPAPVAPPPPDGTPQPATPSYSASTALAPPSYKVGMERLVAGGLAEEGGGHSRIAEEFRLVQQQILRGAFGTGLQSGLANLVMVTSSRPNEGKTFTAINLAYSIARRGDHKVLLVDADAKNGSLSDLLGIGERTGLLDLASDPGMEIGASFIGSPMEGLSILPIGCQRAHRGDVFASDNMMRIIQDLGRHFSDRLVVLDVAPCLSTSDPAMLAGVVGQVLFVVEAESTQRDEVEAALDLIQTCPTITLLLNKVQMSTSRSFGAYSYSYSS